MADLAAVIEDLVTANHVLAAEHVVDSFGHVSVRHPHHHDRYLLARNRSPELIEPDDIMEHGLDGEPVAAQGRTPYGERFIHAAMYKLKPEVQAVVHSHSQTTIPFGVTAERLRPISHVSATIGLEVPVWDPQTGFGDTNLLVHDLPLGLDLAQSIGASPSILMRGHGATVVGPTLREAVYTAVYLEVNAKMQLQAKLLNAGPIKFLTPGEVNLFSTHLRRHRPHVGFDKAWENWCRKVGRPHLPLTV